MSASDAIGFGGPTPIYPHNLSSPPREIASSPHHLYAAIQECESTCKGFSWRRKVRGWVDECKETLDHGKTSLDRLLPNNRVQQALDDFGAKIEELLAPVPQFNNWIQTRKAENWYGKLALILIKLPIHPLKNCIKIIYGIIKGVSYGFVHPLKASLDIGKLFVEFVYSLTRSETYTKMGAQTIGASLGQVVLSGGFGPHAYIGLGIGGAMLLFGMIWGAIEAGMDPEEKHKVKGMTLALAEHLKIIPEGLIVGFLVSATFGAIQIGLHDIFTSPSSAPNISFTVYDEPEGLNEI